MPRFWNQPDQNPLNLQAHSVTTVAAEEAGLRSARSFLAKGVLSYPLPGALFKKLLPPGTQGTHVVLLGLPYSSSKLKSLQAGVQDLSGFPQSGPNPIGESVFGILLRRAQKSMHRTKPRGSFLFHQFINLPVNQNNNSNDQSCGNLKTHYK